MACCNLESFTLTSALSFGLGKLAYSYFVPTENVTLIPTSQPLLGNVCSGEPCSPFLYLTLTHLTPHLENIYSLLRSTVDPSPALTTVNQTNHTDLCQIQTSDINICISLFLLLDQQITQGVFKKYHIWALYWSLQMSISGAGPKHGYFFKLPGISYPGLCHNFLYSPIWLTLLLWVHFEDLSSARVYQPVTLTLHLAASATHSTKISWSTTWVLAGGKWVEQTPLYMLSIPLLCCL